MSNTLIFVGRIGKDAEQKQSNGKTFLKFSVGESVGFGENKTTNWWNCTLFGKQAESTLVDYLQKGSQVQIVGEVKFREYEGKSYNDVMVSKIELVGSKSESQPKASQPQQTGGYGQNSAPKVRDDLDSDTLPF